jgi:hypothetical protein
MTDLLQALGVAPQTSTSNSAISKRDLENTEEDLPTEEGLRNAKRRRVRDSNKMYLMTSLSSVDVNANLQNP